MSTLSNVCGAIVADFAQEVQTPAPAIDPLNAQRRKDGSVAPCESGSHLDIGEHGRPNVGQSTYVSDLGTHASVIDDVITTI